MTGRGPVTGGPIAIDETAPVGTAQLRWASRASTIDGIERELARIWTQPKRTVEVDGVQPEPYPVRLSRGRSDDDHRAAHRPAPVAHPDSQLGRP